MSCLAVIPARGGSKRIPRKNVRPFLGRPILDYPISAALESGLFDEVMVSTDDGEIASVARASGASVPFLRSERTANDFATLSDVLVEVLQEYRSRGRVFDQVCCLLATAALVNPGDLSESHKAFEAGGFDSLVPVVRFGFPIYRALKLEGDRLEMIWPENKNVRSQDLPPAYHDAGAFYWLDARRFEAERAILTPNTGGYELPESRVQDIDTEEDWRIAELKFGMRRSG